MRSERGRSSWRCSSDAYDVEILVMGSIHVKWSLFRLLTPKTPSGPDNLLMDRLPSIDEIELA
jgi:hypothetical protein